MSWLCRDPGILEEDLDEVFRFESRTSRTFVLERRNGAPDAKDERCFESLDALNCWINQNHVHVPSSDTSKIQLILGDRAKRNWGHDPSILTKLPWSRDVFANIRAKFLVHGSIARTINRSTSCLFSRMSFEWNSGQTSQPSIVYNCRSASSWAGDMAMSVTFLPKSMTTKAVLFGCDMDTPDKYDERMTIPDIIISKLSNSDMPLHHPMLLPAIFADLERDRQVELVRVLLKKLKQRLDDITTQTSEGIASIEDSPTRETYSQERRRSTSSTWSMKKLLKASTWTLARISSSAASSCESQDEKCRAPPPANKKAEKSTAELWMDVSCLRNGLKNWQCQLHKMIAHVDELNDRDFSFDTSSISISSERLVQLRVAGIRIKERLQDLVDEYDEHIRECTHITDGMSLATQLELSHIGRDDAKTNHKISTVNLQVARRTRDDSKMMKSIAMLGMIFLPATYVTSFFSVDFLDLTAGNVDKGLSPYLWVYCVAVLVFTLVTFAIFYGCMLRKRQGSPEREATADTFIV